MQSAPAPAPRTFHVAAKVRQVAEHHYDDTRPGKPLAFLVPGAVVALAALAGVIFIVYQTWYLHQFSEERGVTFATILGPLYAAGVFVFSYGYELYNFNKALRLTVIIVVITVLAVILIAALFAAASASKDAKGSKSSGSKSSSSSGNSVARPVFTTLSEADRLTNLHPARTRQYAPTQQVSTQPQPLQMHCQFCGKDVTIQPSSESVELKCPSCQAPLQMPNKPVA